MNICFKCLGVLLVLIAIFSFTKKNKLQSDTNLNYQINSPAMETNPLQLNHSINSSTVEINSPIRSFKHINGKTGRNHQKSIVINNPSGNGNIVIKYTELELTVIGHGHSHNDEEEDHHHEHTETIRILNPTLRNGDSLFFRTQPITIKHSGTTSEVIDEVVEVSNQRYESDQCQKLIEDSEELQDSLIVAEEINGIWQEKTVYLAYHRLSFADSTEAIFRPCEFFNINDTVIYVSETYTIEGIQDTIEVSKWCNSDRYPHVIDNVETNDHYEPVGCE